MMGLYVMKDVPFRDVYLHALVRDERGEKMSKSRGNSIDPLEMIEKYGADAFRYTLAAFTAQGRDVRMSEERISGYKFFVNKIWNAARFTLMHLQDFSPTTAKTPGSDLSLPDRWIRSRLGKAVEETKRHLDAYRFNDAASTLYQFLWHELCDWYLELVKPALYGKTDLRYRDAAKQTLSEVMMVALKLLHPFMPYVTEEIWQALVGDGSSIVIASYPEEAELPEDREAEEEMGLVMDIITRVRNVRGEMGLPPSKPLAVVIPNPSPKARDVILRMQGQITILAHLASLIMTDEMTEPKGAATAVIGDNMKMFVLLEGAIDPQAEKARLEKELAKIKKDLTLSSMKLANNQFLTKASPQIVAQEREKLAQLTARAALLETALKKVEELIAI